MKGKCRLHKIYCIYFDFDVFQLDGLKCVMSNPYIDNSYLHSLVSSFPLLAQCEITYLCVPDFPYNIQYDQLMVVVWVSLLD